MSLYAGIDLHSSNSVPAVIDEHDRVLRQCRLPNELPTILKSLEPFHDELVSAAVESTYNWYWLVDGLTEHGYRMHLVNTAAVPQYDGLKYSGDESDARHLAHLMRLGIYRKATSTRATNAPCAICCADAFSSYARA